MPPPQIRDPMHMHIHPDALIATPRGAHAQIGHLGPHAWQRDEPCDGIRDVGSELRCQDGGGGFDVSRFVVVEADGVDEGVEGGGVDGEDAFEGEAVGGREGGLQAGHGEGGGGVAGLGGEH